MVRKNVLYLPLLKGIKEKPHLFPDVAFIVVGFRQRPCSLLITCIRCPL